MTVKQLVKFSIEGKLLMIALETHVQDVDIHPTAVTREAKMSDIDDHRAPFESFLKDAIAKGLSREDAPELVREAHAKIADEYEARERAAKDAEQRAQETLRKAQQANNEALLGSSTQPTTLTIGGKESQLGDVVASAHKRSGLSVEQWNDMDQSAREKLISDEIDEIATRLEQETRGT